jgi:hypothetical protein
MGSVGAAELLHEATLRTVTVLLPETSELFNLNVK